MPKKRSYNPLMGAYSAKETHMAGPFPAQQPLDLNNLFTYHPPKGDQAKRYEQIREAGKALAAEIIACTPASADQSAAVRKVREAVMTANAAIACGE